MPITLSPLVPRSGWDDDSRPTPFQMVPLGQSRSLRMRGNENGNWTLTDQSRRVQTELRGLPAITELHLFGRAAGKVEMSWTQALLREPVGLEVAVLPPRRFRVAFRFVGVADGRITTQRPPSDVPAMFATARDILRDQANVLLENMGSRSLSFQNSFGRIIDDPNAGPMSNDARRLSAQRDIASDVTVFFVRHYDQLDTSGDEMGGSRINNNSYIIMQDDTLSADPGLVLAHELVHNLGHVGHSDRVGDVMQGGRNPYFQYGRVLNRAQILTINPGWRTG